MNVSAALVPCPCRVCGKSPKQFECAEPDLCLRCAAAIAATAKEWSKP